MSQTTEVSFTIDAAIKEDAERVLRDMGLTVPGVMAVFLEKVGREKRVPEPADLIPNAETIEAIREVEALKENPDKASYASFQEMLAAIKAEGPE